MRRNILTAFVISFFFALQLFAASFEIKSLRIYSSGEETSFPVVDISSDLKKTITIDFDVDGDDFPNLMIQFRFCDSQWKPYQSPFLADPLFNYEPNLYLDKLPLRVSGARYHYSSSFPNNNVRFPFSGKWMFFILDSRNRGTIISSGKFFVVNTALKMNTQVFRETMQGNYGDNSNLGRTLAIKTSFTLFDSLFASNVKRVEIVKNRMINSPIVIDRNTNSQERYYEWDANRKFSFVARILRPGNEYRQTDTRNVSKYNTPTVDAHFGETESSDLFTRRPRDNNGGTLLMNWRNENADYHNVVFKLRAPDGIKTPIFLVGSFTDWRVLPEYEMYDDKGMMNLSVLLKRGVYDYQYVTADVVNDQIQNANWEILEGNFFETDNEYNIFLFYESTEKGGYDQIIGYATIRTGAL